MFIVTNRASLVDMLLLKNSLSNSNFSGGRSDLAWVVDAVAANDEPYSILYGFLGTDTAHELAIYDVFHAVAWDFTSVDELYGVGAFDATTHAICESSEFVC